MSWANYLFLGLREKSGSVTQMATSIDTEIAEKISESVTSYTTKSNEDAFKLDTIFDSFHHQAMTPISDRALLAGFLILWLNRYAVPILPHEVIIVDVVYSAVLHTHGRSLGLLPAMKVVSKVGFECCIKASAMLWLKKTMRATLSSARMVNTR